jgi:hypothetical protein
MMPLREASRCRDILKHDGAILDESTGGDGPVLTVEDGFMRTSRGHPALGSLFLVLGIFRGRLSGWLARRLQFLREWSGCRY